MVENKKNMKPKSVIISGETHENLKIAIGKKYKIGQIVEQIINDFLEELKIKGEEILIKKHGK